MTPLILLMESRNAAVINNSHLPWSHRLSFLPLSLIISSLYIGDDDLSSPPIFMMVHPFLPQKHLSTALLPT